MREISIEEYVKGYLDASRNKGHGVDKKQLIAALTGNSFTALILSASSLVIPALSQSM